MRRPLRRLPRWYRLRWIRCRCRRPSGSAPRARSTPPSRPKASRNWVVPEWVSGKVARAIWRRTPRPPRRLRKGSRGPENDLSPWAYLDGFAARGAFGVAERRAGTGTAVGGRRRLVVAQRPIRLGGGRTQWALGVGAGGSRGGPERRAVWGGAPAVSGMATAGQCRQRGHGRAA